MITLSQRLAEYLAVRRSLGFDLTFEERVLKVFTALVDREKADHLAIDLFLRWKGEYGNANNNTWAHRLGMVRTFGIVSTKRPIPTCESRVWLAPRILLDG